jgi:hypothetical protein
MRNRIKPNKRKFRLGKDSRFRKIWTIGLSGLFGLTLFWGGYHLLNLKPSATDLPDYAVNLKRADWNEYTQIGQAVSKLTKGWIYSPNSLSDKQLITFDQKISKESLSVQTTQIKLLFTEEEAFRKADLDKALESYRSKLNLEMERELEEQTNRLKKNFQKEVTNQELALKNAIAKYNDELAAQYQVTLANLQLQLLLVDLSSRIKEPELEKQRIQEQIDSIHQEMYDKISIRQQQLGEELVQYKKQRQMLLDSEIASIRKQLINTTESALNQYRKSLEADFYQWRQQRQQDIQMVINLRQSQL